MLFKITALFFDPTFFLSRAIFCKSVSIGHTLPFTRSTMILSCTEVGNPYPAKQSASRETATGDNIPMYRDNSASFTAPTATHSPWSACGVRMASYAWPIEWPKFNKFRSPPSLSSLETTSAFTLIDSSTSLKRWSKIGVMSTVPSSRLLLITCKNSRVCSSSLSNSFAFQMADVLITSPMPFTNCRTGKVSKNAMSTSTSCGCQNAPMKFLPNGVSMAVLPPIEESTIDNNVVGT